MSFRELLRFILETTRRRRWMVEWPLGLARFQARVGEMLPKPPLTRDQLLMLERDNVVAEGAPGLRDLGVTPKAVEAVVPGYIARYRRGGSHRDLARA
jgi:NADH dehydrogenase